MRVFIPCSPSRYTLHPIVERGGHLRIAMAITAEEILAEIGPVQEILDAHDGVVTVLDTSCLLYTSDAAET